MYLMYTDESGDVGNVNSPTKYFCLSALVIHETNWLNLIDDIIEFRKSLKEEYGLKMKEEIHTSEFINGRNKLKANIQRFDRLAILKKCLIWLNTRNDINIITVRFDKNNSRVTDVFDYTWHVLIQRFENTLSHNNFPGGTGNDKGILLSDDTEGGKLRILTRKMRRFNQIPNMRQYSFGSRNLRLRDVIEDPILRNSKVSYIHQMVDIIAYFARQHYEPNKFVKKKGAKDYYNLLKDVTNQYVTYRSDSFNKIVEA